MAVRARPTHNQLTPTVKKASALSPSPPKKTNKRMVVMRPLTFVVQAEPRGDWLHVRGSFEMLQSDFGIEPLTKAFGAIGVQDKLQAWGDLWVAARPTRR